MAPALPFDLVTDISPGQCVSSEGPLGHIVLPIGAEMATCLGLPVNDPRSASWVGVTK